MLLGARPRMEAEIAERPVAQEERRNGERTEKTDIHKQLKMSCLLRSTSVAPFLLLVRVLRDLRALARLVRVLRDLRALARVNRRLSPSAFAVLAVTIWVAASAAEHGQQGMGTARR